MARRRSLALIAVAALFACPGPEPEPEPEQQVLASADAWLRVTDPGGDWFADMRPDDAFCDDAGYYMDPLTQNFEIETAVCDYLTVRQPTLVDLEPGDRVEIRGIHGELSAEAPAEGYVALALDGELLWSYQVAIPSPAAYFGEEVPIDRSIPAGAELQLHVHNHGPNTWELAEVLAVPPGA